MTETLDDTRDPFDVVRGQGKHYRLWCKTITLNKPVVILVHGAVVPLLEPNELYDKNCINNEKYCSFNQLDYLLYYDDNLNYNVFTFEYADWVIFDPLSVNYHRLAPYGDCLIEAIGIAKNYIEHQGGTVGPVTVIAHSMGGLIARYAVQALGVEEVKTLITLDTGHRGFDLANVVDDLFVDALSHLIPMPTLCSIDAASGSHFVTALNNEYAQCPPLLSIAAVNPIELPSPVPGQPPIKIIVVPTSSSNMGQFCPLPYDHLSITQITDSDHGAYKIIKKSLANETIDCVNVDI